MSLIPAQAALRKTPAEEEAVEVHLLQQALADCGGNKAEAARSLGIPRSTFFSKLKKHGLG
jgi:transcriptional regulator of acetoin/glycerol metabolism